MQDYFYLVTILSISFIFMQGLGDAFGQRYADSVRITADFVPDKFPDEEMGFSGYDMITFSLSYTNGSRLCPTNSCIFQFQGGYLALDPVSPDSFFFDGVLRVGIQDSQEGIRYRVYHTSMDLRIIETFERSGIATHNVTGGVNFGDAGEYEIYGGTLTIGGGYVRLDVTSQNPSSRQFVM